MCDDATRNTVNAVIGMLNAAMNTTFTPIRQPYEAADGAATSRMYRPGLRKIAPPCLMFLHSLTSRGFRRGQRKYSATTAIATGIRTGCDATKPPASSDGEPFDTVRGRKTATAITIRTLTAV